MRHFSCYFSQLTTPGRMSYCNSPSITMQNSHFSVLCFTAPGFFALDLRKKFRRVIRTSPFLTDVLRSKHLQRRLFSVTQNYGLSNLEFNPPSDFSGSLPSISVSYLSLVSPSPSYPFSLSLHPEYLSTSLALLSPVRPEDPLVIHTPPPHPAPQPTFTEGPSIKRSCHPASSLFDLSQIDADK